MIRRLSRLAPVLFAALALAACSHGSAPNVTAGPAAPAVNAGEIDAVQKSLLEGDKRGAEKQLKALLRREPMNPNLLLLSQSASKDPQELLGPNNYPYAVRTDETIEDIAEHLLGNRLKAYQLARYNQLPTPVRLVAGQTLRIPGAPPRPKPQPVPDRPARATPPAAVKPSVKPAVAAPKPAAPKSTVNPAAAQRVRAQGLAALNRGAVGDAVLLLRRAQALDPGNALIARDLQRAQRIAATVRARK
ncbi:LysM peptidoglycan-binding domain-containing protein [Sphingomonas sp. MMS12-HWE2-04]|uniref:LysM peptidoglycan-binding domain-containing protein n=1 Tax=Sphingomonas sp. MMS12-HWE2-04 TaxID=3234199 RepID=UPI00384B2AE9